MKLRIEDAWLGGPKAKARKKSAETADPDREIEALDDKVTALEKNAEKDPTQINLLDQISVLEEKLAGMTKSGESFDYLGSRYG